jgi:hypothetical protein
MDKEDLLRTAAELGITVDGRWGEEKIMEAIQAKSVGLIEENNVIVQDTTVDDMNALALRIWEHQSPDLPLKNRVERIVAGLKRQDYTDLSGLELPVDGYKKYL